MARKQKRWMKSVIKATKSESVELPWARSIRKNKTDKAAVIAQAHQTRRIG